VRPITATLLDLLVPNACAGCGRPGPAWCSGCERLLGAPFAVWPDGQPPVYALGRYAGPVRSALLAYKERGHRELAEPFGAAVAAGLRSIAGRLPGGPEPPGDRWWLVPVPSRAAQARRRGGDHVARLAEAAAARLAGSGAGLAGCAVAAGVAPALRLSGGVRDSVGLDAAARVANLAGRVRPRRSGLLPAGTGVVLIDDVLTTGATVTESVAALRLAGLRPLAVIVLAVTERRAHSSTQGVLPAPFAKYLRRLSPTADVRKERRGS